MSHSNAEKLMIKKEFFLCIIPRLRLLSTPSPRARAAQPQPWGPVMLRRWGMREPRPWLAAGMGNQRALSGTGQGWHGPSRPLLVAGLRAEGPGAPGACAILPRAVGCRRGICSAGL